MKILGIGNAIVDVICKVDDQYLINNQLTKSTMKLVDEIEFKKLLSSLKIEQTISGGSVANSIVGLSQLGNDVGFIGKVNDDDLGQKYEEGLTKEKVQYFYNKKKEVSPTGTCLILITPDAERTSQSRILSAPMSMLGGVAAQCIIILCMFLIYLSFKVTCPQAKYKNR